MKKTITIIAALTLSLGVFGQDSKSEKKNIIGIGATYNSNGMGGNLSFMRTLSQKLGIGVRFVSTNYKFKDFEGSIYTVKYNNGLFYNISAAANYYILGNYSESKAGLYTGLGIGYGTSKVNSTNQYIGFPSFKVTTTVKGFSGNFTLGGAYKLGPGRIFLETNISTIISGSEDHIETYPDGYPTSGGFSSPNSGGNWSQKGVTDNDIIFCINLGYSFHF